MALVIGNKTYDLNAPGAATRTFAHTQDVGADGYLFLLINTPNVVSVTGVTYGGVAMTKLIGHTTTTYNSDWSFWYLAAPATGANNVVVTCSGPTWNPISSVAISATGCAGSGITSWADTGDSPREVSLSVVETTSKLLIAGTSGNADGEVLSGIISPATNPETRLWNHFIYNYTWGGISSITLASTSYARVTASSRCAIFAIEIKQSGSTPPASRRRLIIT